MDFDIEKVRGIGEYIEEKKAVGREPDIEEVAIYRAGSSSSDIEPKVFLVVRKNTIEVRTDGKLRDLLRERYESVMESRYFGRGGVEIVNSGQISASEINDLVRLSYQLTENAK